MFDKYRILRKHQLEFELIDITDSGFNNSESLTSPDTDFTFSRLSLCFQLECPVSPCLSRCALHPVNIYRAAHSVWALYWRSGVEYVKVRSPAAMRHWWSNHNSDVIICRSCSFIMQLQIKSFIFFPTMTPIDKRRSLCQAQRRHTSACKISSPFVSPFCRR